MTQKDSGGVRGTTLYGMYFHHVGRNLRCMCIIHRAMGKGHFCARYTKEYLVDWLITSIAKDQQQPLPRRPRKEVDDRKEERRQAKEQRGSDSLGCWFAVAMPCATPAQLPRNMCKSGKASTQRPNSMTDCFPQNLYEDKG